MRRLLLLTATFAIALSASANAAPTIFWSNYGSSTIGSADVGAGGGANVFGSRSEVAGPFGTTADPASGKLFWANYNSGKIYSGNLDGSGAPCLVTDDAVVSPYGLTYNPANDTLYWASGDGENKVLYVRVSRDPGTCSTGVASNVLYQRADFGNTSVYPVNPMNNPVGAAIDPAGNRIYWANYNDGNIGYASLERDVDSAGIIDPASPCSAVLTTGLSVNVDPQEDRLYFSDTEINTPAPGSVAVSRLDGTDCSYYSYSTASDIPGVTRDSERVYFPVFLYVPGEIQTAPIGTFPSGVTTLASGSASTDGAGYPVLVDVPTGTASVSPAAAEVGAELTCAATWSVGTPGMQWYRAPQTTSFSWSKDGEPVSGAASSTLKAEATGDYTCTASGTNFAGSRSITASAKVSAAPTPTPTPTPDNEITVRTPRLVGTKIRTLVRVPGAGVIRQAGTFRSNRKTRRACGPESIAVEKAGTYRISCRLTSAARAARRMGAVRVRIATTFKPTGGTARVEVRTLVLRSLKPRYTG